MSFEDRRGASLYAAETLKEVCDTNLPDNDFLCQVIAELMNLQECEYKPEGYTE